MSANEAIGISENLAPKEGGLICPKDGIRMLYKPVQTDHGGVQLEEPPELAQHCTAGIALEKTSYVAGEIVRGTSKWTSGRRSDARTFALLACDAKTQVHYRRFGVGKHRRHTITTKGAPGFPLRANVAQFPDSYAAPGRYQFPFEFRCL